MTVRATVALLKQASARGAGADRISRQMVDPLRPDVALDRRCCGTASVREWGSLGRPGWRQSRYQWRYRAGLSDAHRLGPARQRSKVLHVGHGPVAGGRLLGCLKRR